jgi:hypothetical protein
MVIPVIDATKVGLIIMWGNEIELYINYFKPTDF